MLQQTQVLADGQQAILGRLATLEHNPGPQQAQPQQPPQQHPNHQPAGGALAGGQMLLQGAGAMEVQPPPGFQGPG